MTVPLNGPVVRGQALAFDDGNLQASCQSHTPLAETPKPSALLRGLSTETVAAKKRKGNA